MTRGTIAHLLLSLTLLACFGLHPSTWANHSTLRNDTFDTVPDAFSATFRAQSRIFWDHENALRAGETTPPFIYTGGIHPTSVSLTADAFATVAHVPERINQTSTAITYDAATDDVCWTILSSDNNGITGWTRVGTTAYYYQCEGDTTPNQPTLPANSTFLMQLTITSSAIAAVLDMRTPSSFAHAGHFDVTDPLYGANGNDTTDDSAAIQATITAARGRPMHVPAGTFIVSTALVHNTTGGVGGGMIMHGSGRYQTLFDNRVANGCMLTMQGFAADLQFQIGGYMRDFSVITTTSPAASDGLCFKSVWQQKVENVRVDGLTGNGIRVDLDIGDRDGPTYFHLDRVWLFNNTGFGLFVDTAGLAVENSFMKVTNSFIQNNAAGGMDYKGLVLTLENNGWTLNRGIGGFRARAGLVSNRVLTMRGNDFEHNEPVGVTIESMIGGQIDNTECLQTNPPVGSYTGCFILGNVAGHTVQDLIIRNTFIRVMADASPHTVFGLGAYASRISIHDTIWSVYGAAGQSRFSSLASTLIGVRICDANTAGTHTCYPYGQSTLSTTISTSGQTYTPDAFLYTYHRLDVTAASPATLTIAAPTTPAAQDGKVITLDIINHTGGSLTVTWNSTYKFSEFVYNDPLDTHRRTLTFIRSNVDGWVLQQAAIRPEYVIPVSEVIIEGATITADGCGGLKRISAASAITTNTTNTFTPSDFAIQGCIMHVCNIGSFTITLDFNAKFLTNGSTNAVLTPNDCVSVGASASSGSWYQLAPISVN